MQVTEWLTQRLVRDCLRTYRSVRLVSPSLMSFDEYEHTARTVAFMTLTEHYPDGPVPDRLPDSVILAGRRRLDRELAGAGSFYHELIQRNGGKRGSRKEGAALWPRHSDAPSLADDAWRADLIATLRDRLSERDFTLLHQRYIEGLSREAMATALQAAEPRYACPGGLLKALNSIDAALTRARARARKVLTAREAARFYEQALEACA